MYVVHEKALKWKLTSEFLRKTQTFESYISFKMFYGHLDCLLVANGLRILIRNEHWHHHPPRITKQPE